MLKDRQATVLPVGYDGIQPQCPASLMLQTYIEVNSDQLLVTVIAAKHLAYVQLITIIITFYPLTARVVGAPQMI